MESLSTFSVCETTLTVLLGEGIEHELHGKKCFFYVISRTNGLAATLVTDEKYPQRVAINLLEALMVRVSGIVVKVFVKHLLRVAINMLQASVVRVS